jgi:glycosyltransferase involved in cell wall biosynthesis
MKIQFISSKPIKQYGTTQLRCLQPAEYLKQYGWDVTVGNIREISPIRSGIIFFHRTATNRFTRAYVQNAKSLGNRLIYDTDDLTFHEDRGKEHILNFCDAVTVSTDYLRDKCQKQHNDVHVIRNALNQAYLETAEKIYLSNERKHQFITLGYFSGSQTHDEDFALVQDALIDLLSNDPRIRVLIVGKLRYSTKLEKYKERFVYKQFMPYNVYVNLYREIDINLAPLNVRSEWCNAKSELKYIEAGACGIPTIASPTDTYKRAIKDGFNGSLANAGEWGTKLRQLVSNAQLRHKMGRSARHNVLDQYIPKKRGKELSQIIEHVVNNHPKKVSVSHAVLGAALTKLYKHLIPARAVHN